MNSAEITGRIDVARPVEYLNQDREVSVLDLKLNSNTKYNYIQPAMKKCTKIKILTLYTITPLPLSSCCKDLDLLGKPCT